MLLDMTSNIGAFKLQLDLLAEVKVGKCQVNFKARTMQIKLPKQTQGIKWKSLQVYTCSRICFAGLLAGLLYAIQGPVDILVHSLSFLVIPALLQKAHIPRPAQEKPDFDFYQNSDGDDASDDSDSEDENGNPQKGLDPETRRHEMSANLHKQVCERL